MLTVLAAVISAAFSFAAQADGVQLPIIHKPAQAIANAFAAGANPYTDANGATWGFFQRAIPAATGTGTALTAFTHTSSGMKGFGTNGGLPYVLANDTDHVWNPDDSTYKHLNPGALYFQPSGNRSGIYFQAPRSGYYNVEAQFGRISPWKGHVDVSIVLDGAMLFLEDLNKETDSSPRPYSSPFKQERLFLKEGQRLEFLVGPEITGTDYGSDSSCLDLTITEVEDVSGEVTLIDAGKTMADNMRAETPVNPWTDSSGAKLSVHRAGSSFRLDQVSNAILLTNPFESNGGIKGFNNGSWPHPQFAANINDTASVISSVSVNYNAYGSYPGEIYGRPDGSNMGMIRCVVPASGKYVIAVAARDSLDSGAKNDTDGVNLSIVVGGEKVASMFTSIEKGPRANFMQYVTPIALAAGDAVDVYLDCNGDYPSDGTFMTVRLCKLPGDWKEVGVWDIGAVVNVRAAADGSSVFPNSFTDESGARYSFGRFSALGGNLDLYQNRVVSGALFGWRRDPSETMVQSVFVNPTGGAVEKDDFYVYPRQLYMHPANEYTAVRFEAPATGIYSIEAAFRDVNANCEGKESDGVDCHVCAGGSIAKSARVLSKSKADSNPVDFNLNELWLAAGESIDFAVGGNGGYSCDGTTFQGVVRRTGAAGKAVSADFRVGGTAATFTGKGRYGCGNAVWTDADLTNVKTPRKWKFANGDKSNVTIVMSRRGGALVAASGTDNDLLKDGALSSGSDDVYDFVIAGLAPSATYSLCFYGTGDATWHVGDADHPVSEQWFAANAKNLVRVEASASADGTITGTFASSTSASAVFSGMQIAGGDFAAYEPYGLILVVQ